MSPLAEWKAGQRDATQRWRTPIILIIENCEIIARNCAPISVVAPNSSQFSIHSHQFFIVCHLLASTFRFRFAFRIHSSTTATPRALLPVRAYSNFRHMLHFITTFFAPAHVDLCKWEVSRTQFPIESRRSKCGIKDSVDCSQHWSDCQQSGKACVVFRATICAVLGFNLCNSRRR